MRTAQEVPIHAHHSPSHHDAVCRVRCVAIGAHPHRRRCRQDRDRLLDHWVPAGNEIMRKQVQAWGEANKVEVQMDFITSVGNKILLTAAAEQQAKTGTT